MGILINLMNINMELLTSIGLALAIPLLGAIVLTLWQIRSSISGFTKTLDKAERSLDHNRDEHTKLIGLIESLEKSVTQRIELLEERLKKEE